MKLNETEIEEIAQLVYEKLRTIEEDVQETLDECVCCNEPKSKSIEISYKDVIDLISPRDDLFTADLTVEEDGNLIIDLGADFHMLEHIYNTGLIKKMKGDLCERC